MNENMKIKPVKGKERIPFHCQLCGACCRQVEDSIMLEPMDIYLLSRFLRDRGEPIEGPEDLLAQYTHPDVLAERLPIFLLNTEGPENACVFLKDGRCSVYEARPQVCRMYPFSAAPGERGRDFRYLLCMEKPHHFTGGMVTVKHWISENFTREAKDGMKADYDVIPILGEKVRAMSTEEFQHLLFQFLYYRYYNYELDQPFLPQFLSNLEQLKKLTGG